MRQQQTPGVLFRGAVLGFGTDTGGLHQHSCWYMPSGSKRKQDDRDGAANGQSGRPPPPPHGRRVWASLYSMDGKLQMEQPMDGNICLICNLRCRSFAVSWQGQCNAGPGVWLAAWQWLSAGA